MKLLRSSKKSTKTQTQKNEKTFNTVKKVTLICRCIASVIELVDILIDNKSK
jgi:hypothetical protein